jgi:outer membrane receptor protein involved in Fe transport
MTQRLEDKKRSVLGPVLGIGMGLLISAGAASAQQADRSSSAESLEEVTVTGSRIRRETAVANIAITEIDAEQIELRGFVNPIEGVEQLPFVEVGVNNRGTSTQFGDNNAYINLYGLGSQRTLTLVDGRRMVSSVQGTVFNTDNRTGSQVDVTIINPTLIKSAEIRTVGAGAVYGADAVAGVVNYILDRDLKGFKATAQYGISDLSDGESRRLSLAWGDELFDGRGHLVLAGEYYEGDPVYQSARRPWALIASGNNPLSFSGTDGVPDTVFYNNPISLQSPLGGRVDLRQTNAGATNALFFPSSCTAAQGKVVSNAAIVAACNTFTTRNGAAPWFFGVNNPTLNGLNPLAFVGTFGLPSAFPTVPTAAGSAEATAGLTRVALPLTFDGSGNPTALPLGSLLPPNLAFTGSVPNAGGFDSLHLNSILAGQKRHTFNALFKFELTPSIEYRGDVLYSKIKNKQVADGFGSNNPAGSFTAGNAGIPVFYNQNPFVTTATRNQVNALIAANGGAAPTATCGTAAASTGNNAFLPCLIGGQPVFFMQRALADITGSTLGNITNFEGNISTTFATGHTLAGDLEFAGRELYWEATLGYSENESENNTAADILDIEFALATDVVTDASGNAVCRQKTLAAPEAVNVRNPFLTNLNIATGIVPTAAQVAACVPLNLFGAGRASQAAIDYVTARTDSVNNAEQRFASLQFGGDIVALPGGDVLFNTEAQWRKENLTFLPNRVSNLGLARSTISQPSDGFTETLEAGAELSIPIFGGDFAPFLLRRVQLDGAVRMVEREGEGTPNGIANPRVKSVKQSDSIYNIGLLWSPFDWLSLRGNKSTSIRSPSIVESLGAPQTGFAGLSALFPCNQANRTGGPTGGIRARNCDAFEARLGLPAGTFAALSHGGSSSVPAGVAGSPGVLNETSDSWTAGFAMSVPFAEGLTFEADYIDIRIDKQIALTWLGGFCFDQPDFPVSNIGGESACEALTLATGTGPAGLTGPFTIPTINIITGSPIKPPAIAGAPAVQQQAYTIATAGFSNVNSGSTWLQGVNSRVGYQFSIGEALSGIGIKDANWGEIRLDAYLYYLDRVRTSSSGTFGADTVELRGRPGWEKMQSRFDITHRFGKLTHQVQVFYTGRSMVNTTINPAVIPDQNAAFFRPKYQYYNYNVAYELNDNLTVRGVVNNVFDDLFLPQFGIPGDTLGRNFLLRLDARF